jgi:hypothetical protein
MGCATLIHILHFILSQASPITPGAKLRITSYNAANSIARFWNFFLGYKTYYHASVVAVNSKVVDLGPGTNSMTSSYNVSVVKIYNATT